MKSQNDLFFNRSCLKEINKKFFYNLDRLPCGKKADVWRILNTNNPVAGGDCEDYSLTLLFLLKKKSYVEFFKSLLSGEAKLYFCIYGNKKKRSGHAVLKYRGEYVDNILKSFSFHLDNKKYELKHAFNPFYILIMLALGRVSDFFSKNFFGGIQ